MTVVAMDVSAVGNRLSRLTTSLATDVADPWERLQRISAITSETKACLDLAGREMLTDWLGYLPPMLITAMVQGGASQPDRGCAKRPATPRTISPTSRRPPLRAGRRKDVARSNNRRYWTGASHASAGKKQSREYGGDCQRPDDDSSHDSP